MDFSQLSESWAHIPITRIEDLSDAVYGAGLEAIQMTTGALSGSLAFAQKDGVLYGSGLINGTVALSGPLSPDMITIGLGLHIAPGTWHWMNDVATGDVGVFHPGDEHDSRYTPGTLYATLSIDGDRLEEEAAREGLVLDRKALGGTGVHPRRLPKGMIAQLRRQFEGIHCGRSPERPLDAGLGELMLRAVINHFGRSPFVYNRRVSPNVHARIVERARGYILEHLAEPISLDDIAAAAYTSRRTLARAFADILDDTPQTYVRRLRLHRIRHHLAGDAERACTIALVANQWGMSELGRMSGWYRELFGERPSETRAHARNSETERRPVSYPGTPISA
ncbi:MAG: helix-turn-helix domain-containing protein [Nitrospirales bacterium]|nr:helix-turn-helix domain-containing protein [Nitrospirales bacterium]